MGFNIQEGSGYDPLGFPQPQEQYFDVEIEGQQRTVKVTVRGGRIPEQDKVEALARAFRLGQFIEGSTITKLSYSGGRLVRHSESGTKAYAIGNLSGEKRNALVNTINAIFPAQEQPPIPNAAAMAHEALQSQEPPPVMEMEVLERPQRPQVIIVSDSDDEEEEEDNIDNDEHLFLSASLEDDADEVNQVEGFSEVARVQIANIIKEIRTTEATYLEALEKIQNFRNELRKKEGAEEIVQLLEPIDELLALSRELEENLSKEDADVAQIMSEFATKLRPYIQYLCRYEELIAKLEHLQNDGPVAEAINEFVPKFVKANKLVKVLEVLVTPVQRFPRYGLLMEDLSKESPDTYQSASQEIRGATSQINAFIGDSKMIQELVGSLGKNEQIVKNKKGVLVRSLPQRFSLLRSKKPAVEVVQELIDKLEALKQHGVSNSEQFEALEENLWFMKVLRKNPALNVRFNNIKKP